MKKQIEDRVAELEKLIGQIPDANHVVKNKLLRRTKDMRDMLAGEWIEAAAAPDAPAKK